jgi:hypothetical protein
VSYIEELHIMCCAYNWKYILAFSTVHDLDRIYNKAVAENVVVALLQTSNQEVCKSTKKQEMLQ